MRAPQALNTALALGSLALWYPVAAGPSASGSLAIMIVGQAVAGIGFGAVFTAALRLIFPLAAADQRGGVVAAIYVVSYAAFGVPIVIAGYLAGPLGEVRTVYGYTAFTILLAVGSLIAQLRIRGMERVWASTSGVRCETSGDRRGPTR